MLALVATENYFLPGSSSSAEGCNSWAKLVYNVTNVAAETGHTDK